ncbi:MAG TPA: hypothetical protein P5193_00990 [Microthrixaceae bacterium]|nr:hypothetical protein [Microthrixaceae bacterium]
MTRDARLKTLERLAANRLPDPPGRWATLGDVPTIRWGDPDAVDELATDWDAVTAYTGALDANDWATADRLSDAAHDASRRVHLAIPSSHETPETWRHRLDIARELVPGYVDRSEW